MRLSRLLGEVETRAVRGDLDRAEIVAIGHDSASVVPGTLFCCVPGSRSDGHDFAAAAVGAGAVALLVERFVDVAVPQVQVDEVRTRMAQMAAALYGHPSRRMAVVGVTGTNGKTTTTHFLRSVLEAAGRLAAVIGTLSGVRTTPAAPELQAHLAELAGEGFDSVAMEVSSHAMVQHRVDGVDFAVVVFTNLSQDHLDFHGTIEEYFAAKASLFVPERAAFGVINADDPWGRRLLDAARLPTRPFSMADADDLAYDRLGTSFTWEGEAVRLRLAGPVNVANALAAAAAARQLGVAAGAVAAGLSNLASVPGRNEPVDRGQPFSVLVDYAHTPDALEQTLAGARRMAGPGRVLVVFGCGGDRDRAKRPLMGEVAARLADLAVLTTDNPRSEDAASIAAQVRAGVRRPEVLVEEPDRRAAIALALEAAQAGDVVVLAGKGHETTQVVGSDVRPFDDRAVAAEILGMIGAAGPGAVRPEAATTAGGGAGAPTASEEVGDGAPTGQERAAGPGAVRPEAATTAGGGAGAPTASEEVGDGAPTGQERAAGPGAVRPEAATTAGGGAGAPTASEEVGDGAPTGKKTW